MIPQEQFAQLVQTLSLEERCDEALRLAGTYYANAEAMRLERDNAIAVAEDLSIRSNAVIVCLTSISIRWPFLLLPKALKAEARKLVS